jgi:hypothetical protein
MTIVRRNAGLNHYYVDVLEDGTEVKVQGVTTILSDGIPKGGLMSWAAEQAAQYAITNWKELSGLKLLERAKRIQFAWKEERDAAAGRGTQIHKLAEQLIHGEKVDIPEGLEGHVEACVAFLNQYQPEPVLTEAAIVNRTVGYAGTLDLVADMLGHRYLLDWKTGKNVYAETALQLAAYARGEHYLDAAKNELPLADIGIQRAAVVHLRADGFDVYPMTITEPVFTLFRHVAYVARWVKWDKDTRLAPIDRYKGKALQPAAAVAS